MHRTSLRKVGGSVMLAVPPALLDVLELSPGTEVGLAVDGDRLIVEPRRRPHYTLAELLAQGHAKQKRSSRPDQLWLDDKPRGRELI